MGDHSWTAGVILRLYIIDTLVSADLMRFTRQYISLNFSLKQIALRHAERPGFSLTNFASHEASARKILHWIRFVRTKGKMSQPGGILQLQKSEDDLKSDMVGVRWRENTDLGFKESNLLLKLRAEEKELAIPFSIF
jgi:hypothetical protein